MNTEMLDLLFNFDLLSLWMTGLILFLGLNIAAFSFRYMQGDSHYRTYFFNLGGLMIFLVMMVGSDNLLLFLISWTASNIFLCRMMIHKSKWKASLNSGILAFKNFLLGFCFITFSFGIFYLETGHLSIRAICAAPSNSPWVQISLLCLMAGAITQSAIYPFHRWLLSSLNSPTPVSAIMHAGVINGGGFILLRFSNLFYNTPIIMLFVFVIGIIACLIGTLWKLLLPDIKRSLAASTLSQMGFMFAQFGLGLFSATLAHIILHGLFKSFLFLNSPGAVTETRYDRSISHSAAKLALSLVCAIWAIQCFALVANVPLFPNDTTIVPQLILGVLGFQLAVGILSIKFSLKELIGTLLAVSLIGGYYGMLISFLDASFETTFSSKNQPLNTIYILGIAVLIASWIAFSLAKSGMFSKRKKGLFERVYVEALNSSQATPHSLTSIRKHYNY